MSCERLDRDVAVIVHDFGPRGFIGPVNVNLTQGLQAGGTICVVGSTDNEWFINIYDGNKNYLLHFAARPQKNELAFGSNLNGTWGGTEIAVKNPILKGVRAAVTIVYEDAGYRVFVNGKEEMFYKHRSPNLPSNLECNLGLFYKIVYINQMELIPL